MAFAIATVRSFRELEAEAQLLEATAERMKRRAAELDAEMNRLFQRGRLTSGGAAAETGERMDTLELPG